MKTPPCVMILEGDILIRHPVAEYLRDCGYRVIQAASTDEARAILAQHRRFAVQIVLADLNAPGTENAFALCAWIRAHRKGVAVITAGSVNSATEKAGEICKGGPALTKPYDHQTVRDQIRRALAARARRAPANKS